MLFAHTNRPRDGLADDDDDDDDDEMGLAKAAVWLLVCVGALGVSCYFLVEHTIEISRVLGVNAYVVAVVLTAAATSIPDTLISVAAAKKGGEDAEEAIVNAFSSNIFDILICLSVPVLLYGGTVDIDLGESVVSIVMLGVTTVVTLILVKRGNIVRRRDAYIMIGLYVVFLSSALFNKQILDLFGITVGG